VRLVVAAAVLVLAACGEGRGSGSRVDAARAVIDDDSRYETAMDAADAFAVAGSRLLQAGRECETLADPDAAAACDVVLEASGFIQVFAAEALECRLPEIDAARRSVRAYLESVAAVADGDAEPATVEAPDLPSCVELVEG
jgi:hypothetical protein